MRLQLAQNLTDYSVRNSDKLKMISLFTVIFSAITVIGYPLTTNGIGSQSMQIPIYILAFNFIFVFYLLAEYSSVWLEDDNAVQLSRGICSLAIIGMALGELAAFLAYGANSLDKMQIPFSVSSLLARLFT
ncbi:MAG: hypothetical protein L3J67_00740 [Hyphomicrobiaceae bacterium]|nr:hypothetical protein [Hyphomicrobiaceae bacterium]